MSQAARQRTLSVAHEHEIVAAFDSPTTCHMRIDSFGGAFGRRRSHLPFAESPSRGRLLTGRSTEE
jgi:hypothetical protein